MKLSISLLVSNSIDTIEKCMESLKPILEQVDSELIIVDTGGSDGSIDIAKRYATRIIPFKWCDDFATARNAGLKASKGEWFLWLDDDEWFEDVEEIVNFFNSDEYRKYGSATYRIRNYTNLEGTDWRESTRNGLLRLDPDIEFIRPIHEHINCNRMPEKHLSCYEHHYGYVYQSKEEHIKHAERNISLLLNELKKNSSDNHNLIQISQEYRSIDEYKTCLYYCLQGLEIGDEKTFFDIKAKGWMAYNVVNSYIQLGKYEEAYKIVKEYSSMPWLQDLAKVNISFKGIVLARKFEYYSECLLYFKTMTACIAKLKENPYQLYREGLLELGEIMQPQYLLEAVAIAIQSFCHENEFEKAYQCGKMLVGIAVEAITEREEENCSADNTEKLRGMPAYAFALEVAPFYQKETVSAEEGITIIRRALNTMPIMAEFCKFLLGRLVKPRKE